MLTLVLIAGLLVAEAVGVYRVAPQLPEEYSANVLQWKWNDQGVNHSFVSTVFSSVKLRKMRTDTLSQNEGDHRASRVSVSILDYTNYPTVLNTFAMADRIALNSTCSQSKLAAAAAFPPPPPADFLNDPATASIFAGTFERPDLAPHGSVDAWTFFVPGPTAVTFFFETQSQRFVGYDFVSPVLRTGTTTKLYNFVYGPLSPSIFAVDQQKCPPPTLR